MMYGLNRRRNTPAYAGKTIGISRIKLRAKKHPRLRGEDGPCLPPSSERRETPPLTRGRQTRSPRRRRSSGNTPAYAGKTKRASRALFKVEKHPRLRGEDSLQPFTAHLPVETPPLTRGRRNCRQEGRPRFGNTPAYAGKTRVIEVEELPPQGNTPAYAGKTPQDH